MGVFLVLETLTKIWPSKCLSEGGYCPPYLFLLKELKLIIILISHPSIEHKTHVPRLPESMLQIFAKEEVLKNIE